MTDGQTINEEIYELDQRVQTLEQQLQEILEAIKDAQKA
jgi:prefoldin subunit 5